MLIRFRTSTMEFVGWDDKTPSVRSAWARLCRILSFLLKSLYLEARERVGFQYVLAEQAET